ncbi:MAG: cell division protein SepF [Candidatus Nanopelagicales bacterium]
MATAMKRLGVYLGLVEDDPDYQYDYGQNGATATATARATDATASVSTLPRRDTEARPTVNVAPSSGGAVDPYSIHTIHPRSYNDARRIGEEYRAGSPVIMNLSEMTDSDAKRIVDFAAGLVFAMHGSIERITQKVFLLSPANVDVRDAPAVQQARDGFFNQS